MADRTNAERQRRYIARLKEQAGQAGTTALKAKLARARARIAALRGEIAALRKGGEQPPPGRERR